MYSEKFLEGLANVEFGGVDEEVRNSALEELGWLLDGGDYYEVYDQLQKIDALYLESTSDLDVMYPYFSERKRFVERWDHIAWSHHEPLPYGGCAVLSDCTAIDAQAILIAMVEGFLDDVRGLFDAFADDL